MEQCKLRAGHSSPGIWYKRSSNEYCYNYFAKINAWAENLKFGNDLRVVKSFEVPFPVNTSEKEIHLPVPGYKYYFHSAHGYWQD